MVSMKSPRVTKLLAAPPLCRCYSGSSDPERGLLQRLPHSLRPKQPSENPREAHRNVSREKKSTARQRFLNTKTNSSERDRLRQKIRVPSVCGLKQNQRMKRKSFNLASEVCEHSMCRIHMRINTRTDFLFVRERLEGHSGRGGCVANGVIFRISHVTNIHI